MTHSRTVTPKQWGGLILTTVALGTATATPAQTADHSNHMPLQLAEGGEGGEGGEAGAAVAGEAGYLASLGFIEGHLRSGLTLYAAGHVDMAITHMKHPGDEIYADLAPELAARNLPGFADELAALAATVESGAPVAEAEAAFATLQEAMAKAAGTPEAQDRLQAIVLLARTAAEEYAIGVTEGQITNLHEYQDAHGFLTVAKQQATALAADPAPAVAEAGQKMLAILANTDAVFATLTPAAGSLPTTGAETLYASAAWIELAALTASR